MYIFQLFLCQTFLWLHFASISSNHSAFKKLSISFNFKLTGLVRNFSFIFSLFVINYYLCIDIIIICNYNANIIFLL